MKLKECVLIVLDCALGASFCVAALETDAAYNAGFGDVIVKAYRKRMQQIRAATDERTFYSHRALRFEKLQGKRDGQHSMRLNDQWRLIVELLSGALNKTVHIVEIADYH